MRGLGSIPTGGNILSLELFCFHAVKTKMPILAFLCVCEKPECYNFYDIFCRRFYALVYYLNALDFTF